MAKSKNIIKRIRLLSEIMHRYRIVDSLAVKSWRQRISKQGAEGRLRLLMVIAVPPEITGSGMVVKNLIREHVAAGNDVFLLCAGYKPLNGKIFDLPDSKVDTVIFRDTKTTLTEISPDVNFPIPTFSEGMPFPHIRYLNMTRIQLIVFLEVFYDHLERIIHRVQPDIIHTHHLFLLNPLVQMIAPWIPLVSQAHGTEQKMLQDDDGLLPLVAPSAQFVDKVLSISNAVTQDVIQIYGVTRNRIILVGNGVDRSLFQRKELKREVVLSRFGVSRYKTRIVLFVGKFSKWKGIQYLIGSAAIYSRQWSLEPITTLIVGGGSPELCRSYLDQVQALGLEEWVKVIDLGGGQQETISLLMNIADVFVLPSVSEPLGLVLLEAMACGIRVVAANRGGPAEVLTDELQRRHLASLVHPIQVAKSGEVVETDIYPYEIRLAKAIVRMLSKKITTMEQNQIADSVPSWGDVYIRIRQAYNQAIANRLGC